MTDQKNRAVSSVIGAVLMVAVTVALVALVTVTVLSSGGNVSEPPEATVQVEEQNSSIKAIVVRNENVEKFRLENPTEGNETILGETGSTGTLPAGSGRYSVIAVQSDGSEQVIRSIDTGDDYSSGDSNSGGSGSSKIISGTVTGSKVENATVQGIGADGSIVSQTTTDSSGNYSLDISNPDTARIRVSFVETETGVAVSGSNNVSAAGVKTVGESSTLDFNFSVDNPDVVSESVSIEGVDVVRFMTNNGKREIANVYQLQSISQDKSSDYRLVSDINAAETKNWNSGDGFNPIGSNSNKFNGTLNGQEYVIDGLYINRPDTNNIGLIGYAGSGSSISNIGVVNIDVNGDFSVGGLVGDMIDGGEISNSYATGSLEGTSSLGGLVGYIDGGGVMYSHATVDVTADSSYVGGLIGNNINGSVINSYATGNVTTTAFNGGGLVGINHDSSSIIDSYATGDVSANSRPGGLVGSNSGSIDSSYATGNVTSTGYFGGGLVGDNSGSIDSSYATGSVSADDDPGGLVGSDSRGSIDSSYATGSVSGSSPGGLVGDNFETSVTDSYWDINSSGKSFSGVFSGGATGLNTTDMQGDSASSNMTSLDFTSVWNTVSDDYPELAWESE